MITPPAVRTDSRGVILLSVYISNFWTVLPKMIYAPYLKHSILPQCCESITCTVVSRKAAAIARP